MLKRHGWSVEILPHDVVELILERLPVDSLLRFKSVSKKWKSTIESRHFQEIQFIRRRQSRGPDVLCVCLSYDGDDGLDTDARRFVFGSSIASTVRFPVSRKLFSHGSCDGLLCLSPLYEPNANVVVNPATRWYRNFPLSSVQQLLIENSHHTGFGYPLPQLGFGKDKIRGTYKPVYLYNSSGFGLDNVTTCEVFDFSTNAWRYVVPATPYRILGYYAPVYFNGSLYWFTEEQTKVLPFRFPAETLQVKVLSFDLHTETFQVICKTPFVHSCDPYSVTMCILDNRLCVSEKHWPTQEIWSLDSSGGNSTWTKMCSLDLTNSVYMVEDPDFAWSRIALSPIAVLDKSKLLLRGHGSFGTLVIYDLHTKSYDLLFKPTKPVGPVYYFESLFSV